MRCSIPIGKRGPVKPPYAIGPVPSLSGHANAYRWRSLPPRLRRHRASKPQGSSERVLPWQVTMDQLICASRSHTHYWYEVGMLKVPAIIYGWVIAASRLKGVESIWGSTTGNKFRNQYIYLCIAFEPHPHEKLQLFSMQAGKRTGSCIVI